MRQIKFRAWTGATMEYDVVVGRFGAFYVNSGAKGDGLDPKDDASLTRFNTKYSDITPIMQFTGLHDRNGKEIYYGDILKADYPFISGPVTELSVAHWLIDEDKMNMPHKYHEVVGNIFEHGHLLNEHGHFIHING